MHYIRKAKFNCFAKHQPGRSQKRSPFFCTFELSDSDSDQTVRSRSWRINGGAQVGLIQEMKAVVYIIKVFIQGIVSLGGYCFLSFSPALKSIQPDEEDPFSIAPCRVDA